MGLVTPILTHSVQTNIIITTNHVHTTHAGILLLDLPTVVLEPDVANLQYKDEDAELGVECRVTDANPPAQITWIKVGNTAVYSTESVIIVGSQNTGEFLCTALNSVGPSLTASIKVSVKGSIKPQPNIITTCCVEFPRRLQIEANDFRSSVRLHFPL